MHWELIGYSAAVLTMFGFVPQLLKMVRTKSVDDVSLPMMVQMAIGLVLWLLYGIHLHNPQIIMANLISVSILSLQMIIYFKYKTERTFL